MLELSGLSYTQSHISGKIKYSNVDVKELKFIYTRHSKNYLC